jgi:hypothetical protein
MSVMFDETESSMLSWFQWWGCLERNEGSLQSMKSRAPKECKTDVQSKEWNCTMHSAMGKWGWKDRRWADKKGGGNEWEMWSERRDLIIFSLTQSSFPFLLPPTHPPHPFPFTH